MITIFYFAQLCDQLGLREEKLKQKESKTVYALIEYFAAERGAKWLLLNEDAINVSVNQVVTDKNYILKDGDELAFFPPVTGG